MTTTGYVSGHVPEERGSRLAAHTADCIIEAWGADRVGCLEEAVGALVSVFAEVPDVPATTVIPVALETAPGPDLLVSLLEDVIYTVDVFGKVPVRVHLAEAEDGGVAGDMEVVDADEVILVGPIPKGVSWHGLKFGVDGGTWRCKVVVDL